MLRGIYRGIKGHIDLGCRGYARIHGALGLELYLRLFSFLKSWGVLVVGAMTRMIVFGGYIKYVIYTRNPFSFCKL